MMCDVPLFHGCYAKDLVIEQPQNGAYIINLDDSDGPGTHWVCCVFLDDCVVYFDSYGFPPCSDDVLKWMKSSGKKCMYNTDAYQADKSSACGFFCMMVIRQLLSGIPPIDVMLQFDDAGNEQKVCDFFNSL